MLSPDQQRAFDQILRWYETEDAQTLTFGGYAGTGKTTLVRELVGAFPGQVIAICAPTGKAAAVLRQKGVAASTVHRLIYAPSTICEACNLVVDEEEVCPGCETDEHLRVRFARVPLLECDLVIVDEASMLDVRLVEDLQSFDTKILYVGDHGQLEPVGDDPRLMVNPQVVLEQIHRQAAGSPIIQFAHMLRQGGAPASWTDDGDVRVRRGLKNVDLSTYDIVLCGLNTTRVAVNARIRHRRGFSGAPSEGERMICLQNDSELGIYNGMIVTVTDFRGENDDAYVLDFEDDVGERFCNIPVLREQFGKEKKPVRRVRDFAVFDWGYCLTCHKAQGSQYKRVAVLDQSRRKASRWRYTAATRASETLDYFLPEVVRR